IVVELVGEAEQLVAMVVEEGAEGVETVGVERGAVAQVSDEEVVHDAAVGVGRAAQGEDILAEPLGQDADFVGQSDGLLFFGLGKRKLGDQAGAGASVAMVMGGGSAFEVVA